jgi:hypothetical protein
MISWVAAVLVRALAAQSGAFGDAGPLDEWIENLHSDDVEVRENGIWELRNLGPLRVPELRSRLASLRDPEAIARLSDVIRDLLTREAKRLYSEGRWQEALLDVAEAEGAVDPWDYVEERERQARSDLLQVIPTEIPTHHTDGGVLTLNGFSVVEPEVRRTLPWGIPVLLEMVGDRSNFVAGSNALTVLQGLGEDAAPALCWALSTRNEELRMGACAVLSQSRRPSALVLRSMREIDSDPSASEWLRKEARRALPRLEAYAEITLQESRSP